MVPVLPLAAILLAASSGAARGEVPVGVFGEEPKRVEWLFIKPGFGLSGAAPERQAAEIQLWSVDGEMAFRAPLGPLEPYVLVGGGYSTFGGMGDVVEGMGSGLDVNGVNARGGLGFDYYLTRELSLRFEGSSDIMFLARQGVPARDLAEPKEVGTLNEAEERLLEADGSSAGISLGVGAGLGVHF